MSRQNVFQQLDSVNHFFLSFLSFCLSFIIFFVSSIHPPINFFPSILLSQPLQWPDSNGEILHYAVFCWSDLDKSHWDCGELNSFNLSCTLPVPAHPCTCNLTASNSAGISPSALIHIPGDGDTGETDLFSLPTSLIQDLQPA